MSEIPVIDIAPFQRGQRAQVARAVDDALRNIGFFCITGHGVDWNAVEETASVCRQFFDLPAPVRRRVANHGTPFRGYMGFGDENLSYTEDEATPPDWKEFFAMGRPDLDDPYFRRADLKHTFKANVWPESLPMLRTVMERHYRAMETLTLQVMRILAVALEVEEDFFEDKLDRHDSTFRVANYPHQSEPPAPGQLRAGAHTDYGAITLLKIDDAPGGLQVRTRGGEWVDAPLVAEAFIVNIGDLMMTWTNDRWLSNMHRVVNPPPDARGCTQRVSLVYFVNCNPDALIECIPSCASADNPPRHAPVSAGEHRMMKINKSAADLASA